jgi:hypothetical protein
MTRYALDSERGVITGAWATGAGDIGFTAATVPAICDTRLALQATNELDTMSRSLWRIYTHPAGPLGGSMGLEGESRQRERERWSFRQVLPAIDDPCSPAEIELITFYGQLEASAHRLGRILRQIGDADFACMVRAEVAQEIDAVERAELGDLSGRARQAVVLTRADASPPQVSAADRLLNGDLLESAALFTDVDSTAAAVAAAHWLHAAATVAAAAFGCELLQVVWDGDAIETNPTATPTVVLEAIQAGASARRIVIELIGDAVAVAEGRLPDLARLLAGLTQVSETAEAIDPGNAELVAALLSQTRSTPLDPARPARDLLENLLAGIRACARLYQDHETDLADDDAGSVFAEVVGDDKSKRQDKRRELSPTFITAVRIQAEMTTDQL